MSDNEELKNAATIHIEIPVEATQAEIDELFELVAEETGKYPRGSWDPFVSMHTESCMDSDHCVGPGSMQRDEILKEAVPKLAKDFLDINQIARDLQVQLDDAQSRKGQKCVGIGRIFGHKWTYRFGDYDRRSEHCSRCGFRS